MKGGADTRRMSARLGNAVGPDHLGLRRDAAERNAGAIWQGGRTGVAAHRNQIALALIDDQNHQNGSRVLTV